MSASTMLPKFDIEKLLFGEFDPAAAKGSSPIREDNRKRSVVQKILISLVCCGGIISFFYAAIYYYPNTAIRVANHPLSVNLTEENFETSYKIGKSPKCSNGIDCWVENGFDDSVWSKAKFPRAEMKNLDGYRVEPDKNWIYYRINLKIPDKLKNLDENIAFSPIYVNHSKFTVYLNGVPVQTGNMFSQKSPVVVITIPKIYLSNDSVLITIKGSLFTNEDLGIIHKSTWVLGTAATLQNLYLHQERALYTFYLLFLLAKGGIIVIFSLIFIFTIGQRGFFGFLVFAIFSTLESAMIGDFLTSWLTMEMRINLVFYFKVFATLGLLGFFLQFFSVVNSRRYVFGIGLIFLTTISLGLNSYSQGGWFSLLTLLRTANLMMLAILVIAIAVGLITYRMWKEYTISSKKMAPIVKMTVATALYLGFSAWETFFSGFYRGFDLRPVYDLGFFLYIAFETIREFGFVKTRVLSLETHMKEKLRMQQELKDAADISKVFVPDNAPLWDELQVSVYHKMLSESGGDWFAFETSSSKKFRYFFMCDVTGHGVQAAIVVSTCRTMLTALKHRKDRRVDGTRYADTYVNELNRTLYEQGDQTHITTMCAVAYDIEEKIIHYATCGHPNLVRVSSKLPAGENMSSLNSRHNVLGFFESINLKFETQKLDSGDIIMIHTDGIQIARNIRKFQKKFSFDSANFSNYSEAVVSTLRELKTSHITVADDDDITLVSFRVT